MRRVLALLSAFCLAMGLTGCGQEAERPPEATAGPAFYDAGAAALESGDYAAAIDAFSRAIEADDERAAAYKDRGDCYLALSRAGDGVPGPDMRGLAMRDHAIALGLDPALGGRIYEVYEALGAEALAAGDAYEALCCLRMALTAAPGEAERLNEQARELTDGILTGWVWYMDAPDSRYYEFFADGTGRIIDAVAMEETGSLTYENEGFVLAVAAGDETGQWTYEPDKESYVAEVPGPDEERVPLRLVRMSPRGMYARWQAAILASEAELLAGLTGEEDPSPGYAALYEREMTLLEALAVSEAGTLTEEDETVLELERERQSLLREDGSPARDAFGQLRETVDRFLVKLPDAAAGSGPALGDIFPVGEPVLLDYFQALTDWVLSGRELTVQSGVEALAQWKALEDVDHYFQNGRLYLRLDGCALRKGETADELVLDEHGAFAFATPLTFGDDVTATGEALLSRLRGESWIGLWDMGYGSGVLFQELSLEDDMTCADLGGHYPGEPAGSQSGQYALEGNELTLTLTADGYIPGTYRYEVLPMGDSLYMTLLTDGIIYGQSAGSTCVLCGGAYARDVRSRLG